MAIGRLYIPPVMHVKQPENLQQANSVSAASSTMARSVEAVTHADERMSVMSLVKKYEDWFKSRSSRSEFGAIASHREKPPQQKQNLASEIKQVRLKSDEIIIMQTARTELIESGRQQPKLYVNLPHHRTVSAKLAEIVNRNTPEDAFRTSFSKRHATLAA